MTTRRYQLSLNRQQDMLLPVRAIDAYVDTLDLAALGFNHSHAVICSEQPPFNPAAMLKLYLIPIRPRKRWLSLSIRRNPEPLWSTAS
jgi:hypothetical protein